MDAEKQKTESRAEHHRKADVFSAAELKVRIWIICIRFAEYTKLIEMFDRIVDFSGWNFWYF